MKIKTASSSLLLFSFSISAADPTRISSALQPYVDKHELAGAVTLVVSKDSILNLESIGYSDIAAKKKMQTDAIFWIASMSKPVAASALMMLVDEGRVGLDDPVQKYLPQFSPRVMTVNGNHNAVQLQKPQHTITVRRLLTHTSGMPFSSAIEQPTLDAFPLAVGVQSYSLEVLRHEPGSDYQYSNAGINTIGRIIEVVSSMSYEKFLQTRIFEPLGMKDTTFWPSDVQLTRLAKSYKPEETARLFEETVITQLHYPLNDRKRRFPMPAGGLFSTASDLAKFCQMVLSKGSYEGKQYLSASAVEEMARNQVDLTNMPNREVLTKVNQGYGLGWRTYASGVFGHTGAYGTDLRIDPKSGIAMVWLVQHAGFLGEGKKSREAFEAAVAKEFVAKADPEMRLDGKVHSSHSGAMPYGRSRR